MKIEPRTFTLPNGEVLTVRSLCADDAGALSAFRNAIYSETHFMARYPEERASLEAVRNWLAGYGESPVNFEVGAFAGEKLVGEFGVAQVRPHIKYRHRAVMGISVRKDYWGCGLGSYLMQLAVDQTRANGFEQLELGVYSGIPHLLIPVVTDPKKAAGALSWAVNEMLNRYQLFKDYSVRDMTGFNRAAEKNGLKPLPQIVIIIDELADLMVAAPGEVEDSICRSAQKARAAGIHLIIGTQRPSVDVITGLIKANVPSRIACTVASQIDSRTILDSSGAEKLLGRGDMLFSPIGSSKPTRVQGCFVTDGEVERIIEFIKQSGQKMTYDEQILQEIDRHAVSDNKKKGGKDEGGGFSDEDEMLPSAIEIVVETGQASTSMLQRRLKLGYARAARLMDAMEEKGIIGPFEGSKPRQVLITKERWIEMKMVAAAKAEDDRRNY